MTKRWSGDQTLLLLMKAAGTVGPAPGREPWDYGWSIPEYRRSIRAALRGPSGPVGLSGEGVGFLEEVVELLLKDSEVGSRWDAEELWSTVASLVATVPTGLKPPESLLRTGLEALRRAERSLVCTALANVSWSHAPVVIAKAVVGPLGPEFIELARQTLSLDAAQSAEAQSWSQREQQRLTPVVGFACRTRGQSKKANEEAEDQLTRLLELALLLEPEPETLGLFSLRGRTNQPGVRGLELDRTAVEQALRNGRADAELTSEPLVASGRRVHRATHWFSASPFPLDRLVVPTARRAALGAMLSSEAAVPRRIRVAGHWYSEAHWSMRENHACLALGVALDALLGDPAGLPGRVTAERFALLEPLPAERPGRARRHSELYSVRSAVAHGGNSSELSASFVRAMAREVRWAVQRLLAFEAAFSPTSNKDVAGAFDALRWGTRSWPG